MSNETTQSIGNPLDQRGLCLLSLGMDFIDKMHHNLTGLQMVEVSADSLHSSSSRT
jgi:hypothetical protein